MKQAFTTEAAQNLEADKTDVQEKRAYTRART